MVYFLIIYAIVGTTITVLVFGKVLVGLNDYQLKREADFRFSLVRIRENAETIAFCRGEEQELRQVGQSFNETFDNFNKLIRTQLNLNLFQNGFSRMANVLCPTRSLPAACFRANSRSVGRSRRRVRSRRS